MDVHGHWVPGDVAFHFLQRAGLYHPRLEAIEQILEFAFRIFRCFRPLAVGRMFHTD